MLHMHGHCRRPLHTCTHPRTHMRAAWHTPPHTIRTPRPRTATLVRVSFTKHGAPLAVLSTRHSFIYHAALQSWAALADGAFGMSMFASRLPNTSGELSQLQAAVNAGRPLASGGLGAAAERQAVDSRAHLEATMAAAVALGNADEYQDTLLAYVGHLTGARCGEADMEDALQHAHVIVLLDTSTEA